MRRNRGRCFGGGFVRSKVALGDIVAIALARRGKRSLEGARVSHAAQSLALETSGANTGLNNDVSTAEIQLWSSSASAIDVRPESNMQKT